MISIIGKIYNVEGTDPENPTITELEGFHVNSTELISEWEEFLVEPTSPNQAFFGVATYFYRFNDFITYENLNPPKEEV